MWYNRDIQTDEVGENMSNINNEAVIEGIAEALAEELNREPTAEEIKAEAEMRDHYYKETEFEVED